MTQKPPRRPQMSRFLLGLLAFTVIGHVPFFVAATRALSRLDVRLPELWALGLTVFGVGLFVSRARAAMPDRKRGGLAARLIDVPYFVHWCACIFAILPSAAYTLLAPLVNVAVGHRPLLSGDVYLGIQLVGLVVCGYGILVRRRLFRVEHVDIHVDGLDAALDGFRIAHLSDLHIGTLTPRAWGMRWVRAANAERPDLAVVTGDMVTSGTEFHDDIAAVVGALEARHGVVVAMGNHDYFGDGEPLVTLLGRAGVRVVRNDGFVIEHSQGAPHDGAAHDGREGAGGRNRLYLAAIDDTWTRRDDLGRALAKRPDSIPVVLLAHDPVRFPEAVRHGVDVTLSGHTHGGQIAVPFVARHASLSHLAHKYHLGLYREGRSTLYVHPGLGTTGPPLRIGVAPAVVILTLRRTAGGSARR